MKTQFRRFIVILITISSASFFFVRADEKTDGAVDYKALGFANNLITFEGKPFTGVAIKKDKQGRKRGCFVYDSGLLNGLIEEWYTNGTKSVECTFVKNERDGTNTYWNLDGSLLKRQIWKSGKLIDSTEKHDIESPAAETK